MLKVSSSAAAIAVGALLVVSGASAGQNARSKCKAVDNGRNWEVVIARGTKASATSTAAAATKKGLRATAERDGCGKRYEAVATASSKAQATTTLSQAKKDGYTKA